MHAGRAGPPSTDKPEHLALAGPFGRQVGETDNSHAMREPAFDRRLDQIGRDECKRDRHVDLADAVALARRDAFRIRRRVGSLGPLMADLRKRGHLPPSRAPPPSARTSTSLIPTASRPCLVMRSAMGPASASRRQASSEPMGADLFQQPARMSFRRPCRKASPVMFAGRSTPRSLRREAEDRMMRCVSMSFDIGILHCVGAASLPPPPRPHLGRAAGGAGSRGTHAARNGHTTALFADECQSFLDNVIDGLGQFGSWNDPVAPENHIRAYRWCNRQGNRLTRLCLQTARSGLASGHLPVTASSSM